MVLGIYGAGGLGREILELALIINRRSQRWEDFIFVADGGSGNVVNGVPVYPYDEAIGKFLGNLQVSMGIGEPVVRERLFAKLESDGIEVVTLIHPDVHIPEMDTIGKGVTIQYGCFISCNVEIQNYVLIQPQVSIGHDNKLCEGAVVSSMSVLAGGVTVGRYTYVGMAVAIREGVALGNYSIVGMHSAVHRDVETEMIVMGNPARAMKKNNGRHVFK